MENKKCFTIIKVGYTAGIYGCSNEYFTCILNNGNEEYHTNSIFFKGMYGADDRIKNALEKGGYKYLYTQSIYGQLKRKDIPKTRFLTEDKAIDEIKQLLK